MEKADCRNLSINNICFPGDGQTGPALIDPSTFEETEHFEASALRPNLISRLWRQRIADFWGKRMQKLELSKSDRHRDGKSLPPASTLKDLKKTS